MNKTKFTKTEFAGALKNSQGHIGLVSRRLGVDRRTVYRYLERFPELSETLRAERQSGREKILELAETKLMKGLRAEDPRLIMFAIRHYDANGAPGSFDLDSLFSPDVVAIMQAQNIEASDVVKEFEDLMRAQVEKVELR